MSTVWPATPSVAPPRYYLQVLQRAANPAKQHCGEMHGLFCGYRILMIQLLYFLLYAVVWLVTLGVLSVGVLYARYAIAVIVALLPALGIFWFIWTWFVALPMALLCGGSAAGKKIVQISHWLNDRTGDLLLFFLKLPYTLFILVCDIAAWLTPHL
jgi:hypothetical protein